MALKTTNSIKSYDLFLFAGETSGDLLGCELIQSLKTINPSLTICGVGGPKMRAAGLDCLLTMEQFQVMGFVDVFFALPKLIRYFYFLSKKIVTIRPSIAIFIDYPGFSLRMERHLKKKKFAGKIIHYICPSVWAWGKKRIPLMEQNLDLLLSILPFEKEYFSKNFPIQYVGHPLVAQIQKKSQVASTLTSPSKLLGLFPGSRKKEIVRNLPLQLKIYKKLLETTPDLCCFISLSQKTFTPLITKILNKENLHWTASIQLIPPEQTYDLMKSALFIIAKSGTVSLELALLQAPSLITYAMSSFDVFIARSIFKIRLPFYCLANIIAKKEIFKEFIGPNAHLDKIYPEAQKLLTDPFYREEKKRLCQEVITMLGQTDACENAASLILRDFNH